MLLGRWGLRPLMCCALYVFTVHLVYISRACNTSAFHAKSFGLIDESKSLGLRTRASRLGREPLGTRASHLGHVGWDEQPSQPQYNQACPLMFISTLHVLVCYLHNVRCLISELRLLCFTCVTSYTNFNNIG